MMLHVHAGSDLDANIDGRWIGHEAAECLACDASMVVVEEDEVGNVLNIGRRSRVIPAGMSRALSIRDRGHFFLSLEPEGLGKQFSERRFSERLVFSRGDHGFKEGEAVITGNPACVVHSSSELPWAFRRDITVDSAVTRWWGERMDLGVAVEGLLVKSGFSL